MIPVIVRYWQVNKKQGFDIKIISPEASIADYIKAVENIDVRRIYRPYTDKDNCRECVKCCGGRLPLTYIDLFYLQQGLTNITGRKLSFHEIIAGYCNIYINGPVIDIVLKTDVEGYCIFLDPKSCLCRIYENRPLICRTYYCSPISRRARILRENIVNTGEDELVRFWLSRHKLLPKGVRLCDWQPTPFLNCSSYNEVPIQKICKPEIWKLLTS